MNQPRRQQTQQRRRPNVAAPTSGSSKPVDIWRPVPQLPDPEPIAIAPDPTALVRSLGDPPVPGKSVLAGHYVGAVVERAAGLAAALAASVDLLASAGDD